MGVDEGNVRGDFRFDDEGVEVVWDVVEDVGAVADLAKGTEGSNGEGAIEEGAGDEAEGDKAGGEEVDDGEAPGEPPDGWLVGEVVAPERVEEVNGGQGEGDAGEPAEGREDGEALGAAEQKGEEAAEQKRVDAQGSEAVGELEVDEGAREQEDGELAQNGESDHYSEADGHETAAVFDEEDHGGPDEVELLFYAERPEVAEVEHGVKATGALEPGVAGPEKVGILGEGVKEADEVAEVEGPEYPVSAPLPVEERGGEEEDEEDAVIEGEDAEGAADVEVSNAVPGVAGVVEDAGNEETGEDEEEVDAGPAPGQVDVVLCDNEDEREGSEAVKGGVVGAVFGAGLAGVSGDGAIRGDGQGRRVRHRRWSIASGIGLGTVL